MRPIINATFVSLDGVINHMDKWHFGYVNDETAQITYDQLASCDAMLMGRKTYEAALKYTKTKSKSKSNPYQGIKSYVFSRTLRQRKDKSIKIVSDDAVGFVRQLKNEKGKEICLMGGGDFAKTLFEADLIDEIGFNVHPVLLGSGIPIFYEMNRQIDLELIECKPFKNGTVMVSYRVKH